MFGADPHYDGYGPGLGIVAELYRWTPPGGAIEFMSSVLLSSAPYTWAKMLFFAKKAKKKFGPKMAKIAPKSAK